MQVREHARGVEWVAPNTPIAVLNTEAVGPPKRSNSSNGKYGPGAQGVPECRMDAVRLSRCIPGCGRRNGNQDLGADSHLRPCPHGDLDRHDLGNFYNEYIRSGRGTANVVVEVNDPTARARVTRLLDAIEKNRHVPDHSA